MSVSIGIYDFFSYTIPGVIYLFLFWETYRLSTGVAIPVDFGSLGQLIVGAALAYVAGMIIGPIPRLIWQLFFLRKKSFPDDALKRQKKLFPEIEINFKGEQWPMIFAHLRRDNLALAENCEKSYATYVMLRNISFGFLWFAILQVLLIVQTKDMLPYGWIIILCVIFLASSVWLGLKFLKQYYWKIFEYAISTQLPISEWVKLKAKETSIEAPKSAKGRLSKKG